MTVVNLHKRKWLALGGIALGACMLPQSVFATGSNNKTKILKFWNVNTGERLISKFHNGKEFVSAELEKLNHILRDRRTNEISAIDPKLFIKLNKIQHLLGVQNQEVVIICGYRTPITNASRSKQSKQVAKNSLHMSGKAIDFRIANVQLTKVYKTALSLKEGGVGFYPKSNFIHIDTGDTRTWRGS